MKMTAEEFEELEDTDGYELVESKIVGTSRWHIAYRVVFRHHGKLWMTRRRRAATESQEDDDSDVECVEVEAYEKTVTDYRPVAT